MTDPNSCPLCAESYDDRNGLRVHLEVEHRKSEVVSYLVGLDAAVADGSSDEKPSAADDEPPAPTA
ncbi:hypothetical protein C488_00172 [Natrinema pellirubrum DSM 15624]|uniref:C2H2-type domain-containing protein n=1 Tax=Natrinema pellirubrum (strain DSM 15624 / CIP 106293 / JCM 10476 / NCIMB 786 / 157) TaxID=797303 RepID=L0JJK7_NATP1|nr:hypothetical protein [Natrinema pellirubrum]AGB31454.1 hypothetical protein Natpe_1554 [Natrinema pellirubrum DSM 15624]ELY81993.1 hypothetical protein C488_00172 [Natrinema pellirubrum DSM 15624]